MSCGKKDATIQHPGCQSHQRRPKTNDIKRLLPAALVDQGIGRASYREFNVASVWGSVLLEPVSCLSRCSRGDLGANTDLSRNIRRR